MCFLSKKYIEHEKKRGVMMAMSFVCFLVIFIDIALNFLILTNEFFTSTRSILAFIVELLIIIALIIIIAMREQESGCRALTPFLMVYMVAFCSLYQGVERTFLYLTQGFSLIYCVFGCFMLFTGVIFVIALYVNIMKALSEEGNLILWKPFAQETIEHPAKTPVVSVFGVILLVIIAFDLLYALAITGFTTTYFETINRIINFFILMIIATFSLIIFLFSTSMGCKAKVQFIFLWTNCLLSVYLAIDRFLLFTSHGMPALFFIFGLIIAFMQLFFTIFLHWKIYRAIVQGEYDPFYFPCCALPFVEHLSRSLVIKVFCILFLVFVLGDIIWFFIGGFYSSIRQIVLLVTTIAMLILDILIIVYCTSEGKKAKAEFWLIFVVLFIILYNFIERILLYVDGKIDYVLAGFGILYLIVWIIFLITVYLRIFYAWRWENDGIGVTCLLCLAPKYTEHEKKKELLMWLSFIVISLIVIDLMIQITSFSKMVSTGITFILFFVEIGLLVLYGVIIMLRTTNTPMATWCFLLLWLNMLIGLAFGAFRIILYLEDSGTYGMFYLALGLGIAFTSFFELLIIYIVIHRELRKQWLIDHPPPSPPPEPEKDSLVTEEIDHVEGDPSEECDLNKSITTAKLEEDEEAVVDVVEVVPAVRENTPPRMMKKRTINFLLPFQQRGMIPQDTPQLPNEWTKWMDIDEPTINTQPADDPHPGAVNQPGAGPAYPNTQPAMPPPQNT